MWGLALWWQFASRIPQVCQGHRNDEKMSYSYTGITQKQSESYRHRMNSDMICFFPYIIYIYYIQNNVWKLKNTNSSVPFESGFALPNVLLAWHYFAMAVPLPWCDFWSWGGLADITCRAKKSQQETALNSRIGTLIPLRALSRHRHLIGGCELEWKHSQHCAGRAFDAISTFEGSHAAWVCQSDGFGNSVMPWNSLMPMSGLGIPDFSNLLCSWGPRLTFPQNFIEQQSFLVPAVRLSIRHWLEQVEWECTLFHPSSPGANKMIW